MAPENRSPFLIQLLKRLVPAAQPGLELLCAGGTVTAVAEFIIDLPADDGRMTGIVLRHFRHDALGVLRIKVVSRAVFSAMAKREAYAVLAHAKKLGRLAHQ